MIRLDVYTSQTKSVVAVFIEVARAAAVPHDTAVSGHHMTLPSAATLELFVATFSANEVGMPCIEIADLI